MSQTKLISLDNLTRYDEKIKELIGNGDTTYSLSAGTGEDANKIVLTPSTGNPDKVTVPYATNAGTVNSHTVATDVPANAVFTDTTYSDATTSDSGLMSASDKSKVDGLGTASTKDVATSGNASSTQVVMGNDSRLSDARPASDVSAWAKTSTKPTYSYSEITDTPTIPTITDTYSGTSSNGMSGKAVKSAIDSLDGTITGTAGAGKTLTALSQTDGKVSATFGNISITKSQVSDFPTLGTAAAKNYTTSVTNGSSNLVTSGAVWTAIDNLPEPMVFRGSLGTGGTITALPVDGSAAIGDTYKVITDGTYASKSAKVGDTFICLTKTSSANTWELIPSGDEPSGTVTSVGISNGGGISVSGSPITSSGTITVSHADTSSQASVNNSGRTYIQDITLDTYGHVTGIESATETVTNTDRYVNAASFAHDSTNNNVKMTLTRAGSDTATVTGNIPKVSSSSAGVAPKGAAVSSQTQTTKFLREDGTWAAPSYTTNTNTTYTFANGTNGFTVTPSGGSAQTVTVTPSITNNVTGSGTSGYIAKFNGGNTITNGPAIGSDTTKYLRNDGTWVKPPNDNTWTAMVGATSAANGSVGYVNAVPPKNGYNTKYLRADGTWSVPAGTVYSEGLGIKINGTTINNDGVRSIAEGTYIGTISVDTGGTTADVAVKGLKGGAFKAVDTELTQGSANLITSGAVKGAVDTLTTSIKGKVYNTRTVSIPADNWCCGIFCCNINGVGDIAGYFMFQNGALMGADALIKAVDNMLNITYSNGNIIFEPQAEWATIRSLAIMLS